MMRDCLLLNTPLADDPLCTAEVQCENRINDLDAIVKNWECIQIKSTNNYDYYYGYRNHQNRITYKSTYNLNMQISHVHEEDEFNRLIAVKKNIKTITVKNSNIVSIPLPLYDLERVAEIELTYCKIETFNLNNFINNGYLNKINFSNNLISLLETDSGLLLRGDSATITNIDLSYNLIEELPNNWFSHVSQLKYLNLSHNNIKNFDILTFEGITQLQSLILSYNKIVEIGNTFVRFVNLKTLLLDNNCISNIIAPNFVAMVKLESLNLTNNSIEKIEDTAFQSLSNLENIDLSHNSIEIITVTLFRNTNKIETLSLSHNNITIIESGSFEGKNIKNFFIENNHLSGSIEKGTFSGINVRVLNFTGAHIESLGDEAFSALNTNLVSLNLSSNKLINTSKLAFKSLNLLNDLDLSNNYLTALNFGTEDLQNLSLLHAYNNKIKKIEKTFFTSLIKLSVLDLSQNLISEIETSSFQSLNNLDKLILHNNMLINILDSHTLTGLTSLREIELMNSRVQNYNDNAFSGLTYLKSVNSSHGQLNNIQYNTFQNTDNIEILDLSHNLLEVFLTNITTLPKLKHLCLNNNKIRNITDNTFFRLNVLQKLDISHNNIIKIESNAFRSLTNLLYLELFSNPEMEISSTIFDNITALSKVTLENTRKAFSFKNATKSSVVNLQMANCNIANVNNVYIYKVKNVVILNLSLNKISFIDKYSFQNMPSLVSLDLCFNMIKDVQPGSFLGTSSINILNLYSNYIDSMQFGVLSGLEYLQSLNLSSNSLHSFEANLLHTTPRLSTLSLDNNLLRTISFSDFRNTAIEIFSIGGNPIPCSMFVVLRNMTDLSFKVTTEKFNYHSENVNGITCKTDSKKIIEETLNDKNLTLIFANIADAIKELRHSIEAFGNTTTTSDGDIRSDYVNVTATVDRLVSYYNNTQIASIKELQHTIEILANSTTAKENVMNYDFGNIATSLDRLASYYNQTQTRFDEYFKILTDINNVTKFNLKHIDVESDMSNFFPFTKNFTTFEKENDVTRAELKGMLQSWQSSLTRSPGKNRSVEDIKVLLYFISVCMAIMLVSVMCCLLYMLVKRNVTLRSSFIYNSSQPIANTMEME